MSEPNYRCTSYRLYSFLHYPDDAICRPSQLSRMGFWSTGHGEEVTCSGCGVSHTNFQPRQSIRRAHMQESPECPLNVIGDLQSDDANAVANVIVGLPQDLPVHIPREDLPIDDGLIICYSFEQQKKIKFDRTDPKESGYRWLHKEGNQLRRLTFYDWSAQDVDWKELALRGLFYTGTRDMVRCCECGVTYSARLLQAQPSARKDSCPLPSCRTYFF